MELKKAETLKSKIEKILGFDGDKIDNDYIEIKIGRVCECSRCKDTYFLFMWLNEFELTNDMLKSLSELVKDLNVELRVSTTGNTKFVKFVITDKNLPYQ